MNSQDDRQMRFMQAYSPLHDRLVRFVQSILYDREEARDIISETLLAAYEQFDQVRNPDTFLYYLFTIAKRKIIKREKRQQKRVSLDEHTLEISDDSANHAMQLLQHKELYRALAKMDFKYSEPLVLFEISGFSIREISELLSISESGVKSRLVRARIMLSALLEGKLHQSKKEERIHE
ncbi:RNA polymerase sigma-70 factor [soil metagenome]